MSYTSERLPSGKMSEAHVKADIADEGGKVELSSLSLMATCLEKTAESIRVTLKEKGFTKPS